MNAGEITEFFRVDDATYEVEVKPGVKLLIASVSDINAIAAIEQCAVTVVENCEAGRGIPAEWVPFLPITLITARMMIYFSELIIEPKFTQVEALRLCKQAGPFPAFLFSKMTMKMAEKLPLGE